MQGSDSDDELPYIGAPAASALEAVGVTTRSQLSEYSEKDLLALHGVGPKVIRMLRDANVKLKEV